MIPKPTECAGCPMYGDGAGFVPDRLTDAPVLLLAQNPGSDEEQGRRVTGWEGGEPTYETCPPQPLVGRTGWETGRLLALAGFTMTQVSVANVLKCRQSVKGRRVNDLPTGRLLDAAVAHCTRAHLRIPESTRLVVAMGALAAKVTGCPGSITDWRGYTWPAAS